MTHTQVSSRRRDSSVKKYGHTKTYGIAFLGVCIAGAMVSTQAYATTLINGFAGLNGFTLPLLVSAAIVGSQVVVGRQMLEAPDRWILALALWAALSSLWSKAPDDAPLYVFWYFVCATTFVVVRLVIQSRRRMALVSALFVSGAALVALVIWRDRDKFADTWERASAFSLNPNLASYTIVTSMAIALGFITLRKTARSVLIIVGLIAATLVVGLSDTRGSLAALGFLAIPILMFRVPRLAIRVLLGVAAVWSVVVLLGWLPFDLLLQLDLASSRATGDLSGRLVIWPLAQQIAAENQPFGVGVGSFPAINSLGMGAHNAPLELAAELGIVGLLIYSGWIVSMSRKVSASAESADIRRYAFVLAVWIPIAFTGQWTQAPVAFFAFALVTSAVVTNRAEDVAQ